MHQSQYCDALVFHSYHSAVTTRCILCCIFCYQLILFIVLNFKAFLLLVYRSSRISAGTKAEQHAYFYYYYDHLTYETVICLTCST